MRNGRAVSVPGPVPRSCRDRATGDRRYLGGADADCAAQTPPWMSVVISTTYLSAASVRRVIPSVALGALRFDSQSKRSSNSHKVSIRWGNRRWRAQCLNARLFEYRPACESVVESARVDDSVIIVLERPAGYLLGETALLAEDRQSTGSSAQVDIGETQ